MTFFTRRIRQWRTRFDKSANLVSVADQLRDAKHEAAAALIYEQSLLFDPNNASLHVQCGHMLKESGQIAKAGPHYHIADHLNPNDVDIQVQLGHYYKVAGNLEAAIGYYRRATEIDPAHADARYQLETAMGVPPQPSGISAPQIFEVIGSVDGMRSGQLLGWALRREVGPAIAHGNCEILVTCDNAPMSRARADRWRNDIAETSDADPSCGFQITIPDCFRSAAPQAFRVYVMPDVVELTNSPYISRSVDDAVRQTLIELSAKIDHIYNETVKLRNTLSTVIDPPEYSIDDYHRWAEAYYAQLKHRQHRLVNRGTDVELVSIVMPTFRPAVSDFVAAVQSVVAQTYPCWELIIVDDASNVPELTDAIASLCASDNRVRCINHRINQNISAATNTAIRACRGSWIAFMDHDDLLVDVALDIMISYAYTKQAKVLYSDEDKIDRFGYFSSPNLKPSWNYRYLLGCNYVCHFLFVKEDVLHRTGELRSDYNGAQDHDLMLRIAEFIPADEICHVPEILYHWRKAENSTAVKISNKDYAMKAGIRAVRDHLNRAGFNPVVEEIGTSTMYRVKWESGSPQPVCIVVIARGDGVAAQACIGRLKAETNWPGLEILLVNTVADRDFFEFYSELTSVKILDRSGKYTEAQLRNVALTATQAAFIVFLDPHLVASDAGWLRTLMNEVLSDPKTAIAGAKCLYSNGTVQHAGFIVNPVDIGAAAHRGLPAREYGFNGRAMLSHEITAVSAECMLIRADAFRSVSGFDERLLTDAYIDVDLCLKLRNAEWKVLLAAECVMTFDDEYIRVEPPDRSIDRTLDRQAMRERWGMTKHFQQDPHYNPHFLPGGRPYWSLALCANPTASDS